MNIIKRNNSTYLPGFINYFDDMFDKNWNDLLFNNKNNSTVPSVNISESEKSYSIEVAAPGYDKEDFKVSVNDGVLHIKAEQQKNEEESKKKYAHREFFYSSFQRSFTLPENVKSEEIEATYKRGVLHIMVPKKEVQTTLPTKEIEIK